jgi:hypothetical protein
MYVHMYACMHTHNTSTIFQSWDATAKIVCMHVYIYIYICIQFVNQERDSRKHFSTALQHTKYVNILVLKAFESRFPALKRFVCLSQVKCKHCMHARMCLRMYFTITETGTHFSPPKTTAHSPILYANKSISKNMYICGSLDSLNIVLNCVRTSPSIRICTHMCTRTYIKKITHWKLHINCMYVCMYVCMYACMYV